MTVQPLTVSRDMNHTSAVQLAVAETIDRVGHAPDEVGEHRLVVYRHRLACLLIF